MQSASARRTPLHGLASQPVPGTQARSLLHACTHGLEVVPAGGGLFAAGAERAGLAAARAALALGSAPGVLRALAVTEAEGSAVVGAGDDEGAAFSGGAAVYASYA